MTTVLLHGFWGAPSDWTAVINKLPLGAQVWVPDLYERGPLAPHHDIAGWCGHFWEALDERVGQGPVQALGYSMGGRLLVNLLMHKPERLARALVLSANPFAVERSTWEQEWRNKFLQLPWVDLERLWNAQAVFSGSSMPERRRSEILREMLGQSLINWSPAKNIYSQADLKHLGSNVDWVFGAMDEKYVNVAQEIEHLSLKGQTTILENAGHRLPLESAEWIAEWAVHDQVVPF